MIVSIHQPNFFPWMPFFEKMAAADVFVLMAHCQYESGGYQNRFSLGGAWHSMRVGHRMLPLIQTQYSEPGTYWARIKLALPEYGAVLERFDDCISASLADTNCRIIARVVALLDISTRVECDEPTSAAGTERLVELCRKHGGDTYLSGPSGPKYMDMGLWQEAGIKVQVHQPADKRPILEVLRERL